MTRVQPLRSCLLLVLPFALALGGCPSGVEDDAGTPETDAGLSSDAGSGRDAGEQQDAGGSDAGAPDAGAPDAGEPEDDAGPEPPVCVVDDPCADVPVTAEVRFEPGASSTNAFGPVGAATLIVGESTRAEVEAALGAPEPTENPFRGWHCAHGVRVEYVDDLAGDKFEGNGSAGDVVARVVTLPGVQLSNGFDVTPGQARADAQAALTSPLSLDLEGTGFDASASDGLSVVSSEGVVTAVALFKPLAQGRWDLPVDVTAAAVGQGDGRLAVGAKLSAADSALGTEWDAQGIIEVNAFVKVLVRIYASYGIRVAASCPLFGGSCDASSATIQQIILSPPFVGATAGGIRLGSAEESFTAAFGAGTPSEESDELLIYGTGSRNLGVAYVTDASCTRRAAALLLNFQEL